MTQITIDSEQVLAIASQIDDDNKRLQELLNDSKASIDALTSSWTGAAAEETRSSYESFANKYFQVYYEVLEQYVKFLRNAVAAQYDQTEQVNIKLADIFK
jgi:WXG100 family type VII secretion target